MSSLSSSSSSASASEFDVSSSSLLVCDVNGSYRPASADEVLHQARVVLSRRVRRGAAFESPAMVKEFLLLKLATLDHEVFCVAFVDAKHRLLAFREMFRGTLSQTSVYPREVVKAALELNAAAVVFAHNHPSGSTDPSMADELLTQTLKSALLLVDVRVLDHFVVGGDSATSFAQRGLL